MARRKNIVEKKWDLEIERLHNQSNLYTYFINLFFGLFYYLCFYFILFVTKNL